VNGCDGVVSSLGTGLSPFREVSLLTVATGALVTAMTRNGVRRLVRECAQYPRLPSGAKAEALNKNSSRLLGENQTAQTDCWRNIPISPTTGF